MRIGPFSARDHVTVTTLGLEFACAVGVSTAAGYWADKRWGCVPWLTVTGVLAGFALGMYILVKEAKRLSREADRIKEDKNNGSF